MKTLLTRKTIVIAVIAILIAVTSIISVNIFNSNGPVTGLANAISSPLRSLASAVAGTFESIYASIYRYDILMADYEQTQRDLFELRRTNQDSVDIADENTRLRALLGFRERNTGYSAEDAIIKNWSGSNWSSAFTINKGSSNSTIARGNGVVTDYGVLIGQVSDVGTTTSTVISVLDTKFSAGVTIGEGGGTATVKGDFTLMRSGLLMLDHIDDDLIILPGDDIVTSGAGSVFPAGLVIGEVVDVFRHDTGVGRYATIKPMRDLDTISYVFVITDFDTTD